MGGRRCCRAEGSSARRESRPPDEAARREPRPPGKRKGSDRQESRPPDEAARREPRPPGKRKGSARREPRPPGEAARREPRHCGKDHIAARLKTGFMGLARDFMDVSRDGVTRQSASEFGNNFFASFNGNFKVSCSGDSIQLVQVVRHDSKRS